MAGQQINETTNSSNMCLLGLLLTFIKMVLFTIPCADGISWLAVPDEHTNAKSDFILHWHYEMEKNEKFLSSRIDFFVDSKPLPMTIGSRDGRDNTYHYIFPWKNSSFFSIAGKNNVTLMVHSAAVGQNITYCCEVVWRSTAKKQNDKHCSKVFVYAVPRITYYVPELSCKQGDSIKLQCNTTGFPSPHVDWTHNDTHQRIGSSSHISLNITGKRSGGRYCCDADNGFGRDTACTVVNVTEYEPENTMLLVKQTKRDNGISIRIKCSAEASPPANQFIMTIDDKEYNSSDGLYTIKVQVPRKSRREKIAVSCIPCNKYGQGPTMEVVFPVYAPPSFITPLPTLYNMTISGISMKCETKGIPTPNITWSSGDSGDIASTEEYYNVSYVKCATKTMTFFCHAGNEMGNISSPEIRVNVMTKHNCSTADKGLDEATSTALKPEIIAVICVCIVVGGLVAAVCLWRWIKTPKVKNMDENTSEDPIDAEDPEREGPLSPARTTSTNDNYATDEEFGVTPSLSHVKTNKHPARKEPLCEPCVSLKL